MNSLIHILILLLTAIISPAYAYTKIGCFESSAISGLTYDDTYTYQSSGYCEGQCKGNYVIALTEGNQCYCGSALDESAEVDSSNCELSCTGYPSDNCGGNGYYMVYIDSSVAESSVDSSSSSSSSTSSTSSSSSSTSTESSSTESSSTESSSTESSSTESSSTESSSTESSSTESSSTESSSTSTSSSTSSSSTVAKTTTSSAVAKTTTSSTSSSTSTITSASVSVTTAEYTSIYVSTSVKNSGQLLITIIQSVTSVSVQIQTATSILTATVAASATSSSTSTSSSQNKSSSSSGVSHGAVAGIVVGVVCGTLIIGLLFLWFFGVNIFCIPGRGRAGKYENDDDEKSVRDESMEIHREDKAAAMAGLSGFGRTPAYMYNADEISIGYGNRRFSQSSLPDAAAGSDESDSSNKGGLRVINPDLENDNDDDIHFR